MHLTFTAPAFLCTAERITAIWALLRLRHPPLAAIVVANDWVYDDVRFSYTPPTSPWQALAEAAQTLSIGRQSKHEVLDAYLNGDRTLGDSKLSCLVVASVDDEEKEIREYDWMMCAAHFLGDGMALHRSADDFFTLLAGNKSAEERRGWSTEELEGLVKTEWEKRWGSGREDFLKNVSKVIYSCSCIYSSPTAQSNVLPLAIEDTLPPLKGKFRKAAAKVDFRLSQDKSIVCSLNKSEIYYDKHLPGWAHAS